MIAKALLRAVFVGEAFHFCHVSVKTSCNIPLLKILHKMKICTPSLAKHYPAQN
nr:MAG TPA: hypothetical protein [Caudoviricetes sp.]